MRHGKLTLSRTSRREFLAQGARLGAALALGGATPFAPAWLVRAQDVVPGKEKMIVRSRRYLDLEMPMHLLDSWITPVDLFYVRNHIAEPAVNLAEWRLTVSGEVARPLELTFDELGKLEPATVTNTLECAGNGRAFYRPRAPGIQWVRGAVGNAVFSGPRLADVLRLAGVKATGKHVMFNGLDEPPGNVPDFVRSIPIEKAMHPDTLLATKMNGSPLTLDHGFPVRGLVPGWLGAASVKWLIEVRVLEREFEGDFMRPGYSLPRRPIAPGEEVRPEDTVGIRALDVKSIIARPGDGAVLQAANAEPLRISGAAWAGEADIVRVEVSTDSGRSWQAAQLVREQAKYAWRLWEYAWRPPGPGSHMILSRATDSAGRTQPLVPSWNPSGYLWNVVDQVRIRVEA